MLARPLDADHPIGVHATAHLGDRNLDLTSQIAPRNRFTIRGHLLDASFGDHQSAVLPRPGTKIDQMIRCLHRLLIVLDDDDGVAEVA